MRRLWELYTDEELKPGAERWGVSLETERQRLRILQSETNEWPLALRRFVRLNSNTSLEFVQFSAIQQFVVEWLKQGNSVPVDSAVSMV